MSGSNARRLAPLTLLAVAILSGSGLLTIANAKDQPLEIGPDVVILRELEKAYDPVPFDHLSHAKMAQMWNGCVTCHHRPPQHPTPSPEGTTTTLAVVTHRTQDEAGEIPACKSCHMATADEADIRMPSLKGAYHRQCLGCHREWMHENACVICHTPKEGTKPEQIQPSADDILGRMHPPIPEPDEVPYKMRFTPADGGHVLFRHREHTVAFGIRCVDCHRKDNCSHCHGATGDTSALKPLKPGMTWDESHGPCMECHSGNRCQHCHYKDDASPPRVFDHVTQTGQGLDEDHAGLACANCHMSLKFEVTPTCGDATCHPKGGVDYPTQFPGPVAPPGPESSIADAESSGTTKRSTGNEKQ